MHCHTHTATHHTHIATQRDARGPKKNGCCNALQCVCCSVRGRGYEEGHEQSDAQREPCMRVAVCCSVCVAVYCTVLQCVAVRVLPCVWGLEGTNRAMYKVSDACVLQCAQCVAVCCSVRVAVREWGGMRRGQGTNRAMYKVSHACVWQCAAVCCSVLQCVAVCCSVLQCVAVRVLQCVCGGKGTNRAMHKVSDAVDKDHDVLLCCSVCVAGGVWWCDAVRFVMQCVRSGVLLQCAYVAVCMLQCAVVCCSVCVAVCYPAACVLQCMCGVLQRVGSESEFG